jgi:hypothetical protein
LRVAWYRSRATFARRMGGLVALVLLIGLTGGMALGSIAAARRTQSSFPRFLASTDPSDMTVSVIGFGANVPVLTTTIGHLAGVKRVAAIDSPNLVPVTTSGAPGPGAQAKVLWAGSIDGGLFRQDRVTVVNGRMADPKQADEAVMTASAASQLGAHVGQVIRLGLFTNSSSATARLLLHVKLVGIVVLNNQVVQDAVDATFGFALLTPALIREAAMAAPSAVSPVSYDLQLVHSGRDVLMVEQELVRLIPRGASYQFHATAPVVAQVEDAVKPESIALGAFGAIAALVTLVIGAQAVSRQLRTGDEDRQVLRALGAGPAVTIADGLIGVLAAVVAGSLLAVVVAVALSPLAPLGPVRPVYPASGIAFDWTVLGLGLAGLVVVLSAVAFAIAYRQAPHRVARRLRQTPPRGSRAARAAANSGFPAPAVTGMRFAFEPGVGRAAVPVRSALSGTVLAVAMVVATLTFASGLRTLVSHPPLFGWNWNYALYPSGSVPPQARTLLEHDPNVSAWTGVDYTVADIDNQTVPILVESPRPTVSPPILSGHGLAANDQIVIGAATLARLHKHIGDTVVFSYGSPGNPISVAPTRLRIIGTATFPAVGYSSLIADHTSMGTGALVSTGIMPRGAQRNSDPTLNGPDLVFVRLNPGINAAKGHADMQRIVDAADKALAADPKAAGNNLTILGVQRPAQIVNYRSVGAAPILLAAGLATGAVFALGLTLTASVRRRRRDLALLKTLGFTRRQLAATIATQASAAALIGTIVGVPIGILTGRWLWTLFAHEIFAVPKPTVPALSIVIVAFGALVLANLVAAIPGLRAARTRTAVLLHGE